jgi:ABC-type dipeptide/oligopeptide/nickel transport system permease subunit
MASESRPLTASIAAGAVGEVALPPAVPRRVQLLRIARRNPMGVVALLIVLAFIALGAAEVISQDLFGTTLAPYDPRATDSTARFLGPTWEHPFGTNRLGQDMFSRVLAGARISFLIGMLAVFVGYIPGAFLGIVSGYFQRWLDYLIQRSGEAWTAFPVLFLYLAFVVWLGQGLKTIALVIIISSVFGGSRILRAAALVTKQHDYVEASRALGATETRILFHHVIPNVMPLVIVGASSIFAVSVLAEAALSFLGLGVASGTPSWGIDLNEGRTDARDFPHLVVFPGIAISLVVLGFNLLGDTLRDVLDPRLRGAAR